LRPDLDELLIRRYLLGRLPESEANSLEEQCFADPESLEQVSAVESDLVDAYACGRLPPEDRASFERHYLTSPPHREALANARALLAAARRASRPPAAALPRWSVAAAVVLSLAAGWLWRSLPVAGRETAERPAAAATGAPSTTPGTVPPVLRPAVVQTYALSPTLVRGSSPRPPLRAAPGTDEIVLQLERESGDASGERRGPLTVEVRTVEGTSLWTGPAGDAGPGAAPEVLATVRLPAARLPPGDYLLTLSAAEGGVEGTVHKYYFRVIP